MPYLGSRQLITKEDVWKHNSWDNVEWDIEQLKKAKEIVFNQQNGLASMNDYLPLEASKWDKFYTNNTRNFFKDRNWYEHELPSLLNLTPSESFHIFEIGCGTGSSIFPLLSKTSDSVFISGCDFSSVAINLVKVTYKHVTNILD